MLTNLEIQQLILYLDRAVNENIEKIKKSYPYTSNQEDKFNMMTDICRAISENQILRNKLVQMLEDKEGK